MAHAAEGGHGQKQNGFYAPLLNSLNSWYAVDAGGKLLQCLCTDEQDIQGQSIAEFLNGMSDLTCTSATWDGSAISSPYHALLAQKTAWALEINTTSAWRARRIARWVKYKNRGFQLFIAPVLAGTYSEDDMAFSERQAELGLQ